MIRKQPVGQPRKPSLKNPGSGKVIMTPEKRAQINNKKKAIDQKTNMDRSRMKSGKAKSRPMKRAY